MRKVFRARTRAMPPVAPARRARQETGQARMAARHSASTSVPLHSRVTAIGHRRATGVVVGGLLLELA